MHVMLSAPSPSEAAKFIGQILSIIISTILDKTTYPDPAALPVAAVLKFVPFIPGDPPDGCLLRPGTGFFEGDVEVRLFLP